MSSGLSIVTIVLLIHLQIDIGCCSNTTNEIASVKPPHDAQNTKWTRQFVKKLADIEQRRKVYASQALQKRQRRDVKGTVLVSF